MPGATTSPVASTSVASTNLAGPFDQVIDARQGGTLSLPDNSLLLTIPGGIADTDFVLVSLTEVGTSSASGNLRVGNRLFAMTVVDSGGATVTTFGTPILVTATTPVTGAPTAAPSLGAASGSAVIAALDPSSGLFNTISTIPAAGGQLIASLDTLGAVATTGLPDLSLTVASTSNQVSSATTTMAAPSDSSQSGGSGGVGSGIADPAQILRNLGLLP